MFKFESLATISAFETSKDGGFIVGDHVSLKSVNVGEILLTNFAPLKQIHKEKFHIIFLSKE